MESGAVFPPKSKNVRGKRKCSVPRCTSCPTKDRNVVFHNFPIKNSCRILVQTEQGKVFKDRLSLWLESCNLISKDNLKKNSAICSRHFTLKDYSIAGYADRKKQQHILKKNAVPSLNLSLKERSLKDRFAIEGNTTTATISSTTASTITNSTITGNAPTPLMFESSEGQSDTTVSCDTLISRTPIYFIPIRARNGGNSSTMSADECEDIEEPATKMIDNQWIINDDVDSEVNYDVQTHESLHDRLSPQIDHDQNKNPCIDYVKFNCPVNCQNVHIVKCVSKTDYLKNNSVSKYRFLDFVTSNKMLHKLTGLQNFKYFDTFVTAYDCISKSRKVIKTEDKIMLLFMKLCLNLPFSVLSVIFNISEPTVKSVFVESLDTCDKVVPILYWPSKLEILINAPKCFAKFPKVRVILDATDIKATSCKVCQCKSNSCYNGCNTCKFLIGVTPAGTFSFVSKSYGGRVSDKFIFEESNLILQCDTDEIMVDKGLAIRKTCQDVGVDFVHPTFISKRTQLSRSEAQINFDVAAARVHVERATERVKQFAIFKGTMPWSLSRYVEAMMKLVCTIVNLPTTPVLDED